MQVQGTTASGFEAVRDAFEANFTRHGDVGAAVSVYVDGQPVVDLWGGVADPQTERPWEEDTLQLVFSTTKGATAICALLLAERGELDLSAPVASVWPQFAAEGKDGIPIEWLLTHRSGLPVVDAPPSPDDLLGWDPIVDALARQKPLWEPGAEHGYHALTYGWLVGEVVRRAAGRSLGTFFADEVAAPLGLDLWIGLPQEQESRVSRLITFDPQLLDGVDLDTLPDEIRGIVEAFVDPTSVTNQALNLSTPPLDWNSPAVHAAEIPAANAIGTARSLARMYAATVSEVDGIRLLKPETVADAATTRSEGPDRVLFVPTRFGLGFMLHSLFPPLLSETSFGHAGAGGSLGFADIDARVGFGYVMNKMQQNLAADPRTIGLIEAVRASLAG